MACAIRSIEPCDHHAAVQHAQYAYHRAKQEKKEIAGEQAYDNGWYGKNQAIADQHAHYDESRAARGERRDGDTKLEAPQQLLEHEDGSGERRVERSGEACSGASREQRATFSRSQAKQLRP